MGTKVIRSEKAEAGMVIAADVYTEDYQLIISKDTRLTQRGIDRLLYYAIKEVRIYYSEEQRKKTKKKKITEPSFSAYENKIRETQEFKAFSKGFDGMVDSLKNSMEAIADNRGEVKAEQLLSGVDAILANSRNGLHTIDMMHCMRDYDDLTYAHSVNVSLLCNTIGEWLGYKSEEIRAVTLAGLMHDIGKIAIPPELIKKPGKLTKEEYEIVKSHTVLGYEILKKTNLDQQIALVALCHHERCNGTGYPLGIGASQMNEYSRIAAVADVYDAMTADRVYRKGICPFSVIEDFEKDGRGNYDPRILLFFLEKIIQSYIGSRVTLSDGSQGEVIMINSVALAKPVVRIGDSFVDLSKKKDLRIESVAR